MKLVNEDFWSSVFDLLRCRWRESHNEYIGGVQADLDRRSRHWQVLETCEKGLEALLGKRLVGDVVSIPLNDIAEEMVTIYRYRRSLRLTWSRGAH